MKKLFGIFGAILVGALGSAFWDISKPFFVELLDHLPVPALFDGDKVYRYAAISSSVELRLRASVAALMVSGCLFIAMMQGIYYFASRKDSSAFVNSWRGSSSFANFYVVLLNLVFFTFATFQLYEWTSAARIAREFEHRMKVCKPNISAESYDLFNSRYAQIESRLEYKSLLDDVVCGQR